MMRVELATLSRASKDWEESVELAVTKACCVDGKVVEKMEGKNRTAQTKTFRGSCLRDVVKELSSRLSSSYSEGTVTR